MTDCHYENLGHMLADGEVARRLIAAIQAEAGSLGTVRLMEVCGTHTVAIRRSGIPSLLPDNVILLSGPGCPVCVTPTQVLDQAIAVARRPGVVLATFGDMLRVPGSHTSLAEERARGADVRVVYSPVDAVHLARSLPERQVVFLGIGFETTAPTVAVAVREAASVVGNFTVLSAHKTVPRALDALCSLPDFSVDGMILPGHVSTIIGSEAYRPLVASRQLPCVVTGFEPVDVLLAIRMLLTQCREQRSELEVEYRMAVRPEGNRRALASIQEVFVPADSVWRGLGPVTASGLELRPEYAHLDALQRFHVELQAAEEPRGCLCARVLVGAVTPPACSLFKKACTPAHPVGPCMVSSEGTCAAYFQYEV